MDYRWLPKVDKLAAAVKEQCPEFPEVWLTEAAREMINDFRQRIAAGSLAYESAEALAAAVAARTAQRCEEMLRPSLRRVINATGIVLHTNLGRAVLAPEALAAINETAQGYCNLELDLDSGKRSSRYEHVSALLRHLCEAEDALIVNNNAAAVLLVLDTLARGREAVVSRGQLVEIGGSFRVPEIMERSGVRLREVGTTNKTRLSDYEQALNEHTALLMLVHTSNFKICGFTESVALADLAELGAKHQIPVLDDLGSGCLYPLDLLGIGEEPVVPRLLQNGADIVTFSGDKLLGGPQAGIIVGKAEYIARMKKNPLTRALRVDKFTLAAMEATLRIYKEGRAGRDIPTVAMIIADQDRLRAKAERLAGLLAEAPAAGACYDVCVEESLTEAGGGSLPAVALASFVVKVTPKHLGSALLLARLRQGSPAAVGYIREDVALFDTRTVAEQEIPELAALIAAACPED